MNTLPMAGVYIVNIFQILDRTRRTHTLGYLERVSFAEERGAIQIFEGSEYSKSNCALKHGEIS